MQKLLDINQYTSKNIHRKDKKMNFLEICYVLLCFFALFLLVWRHARLIRPCFFIESRSFAAKFHRTDIPRQSGSPWESLSYGSPRTVAPLPAAGDTGGDCYFLNP